MVKRYRRSYRRRRKGVKIKDIKDMLKLLNMRYLAAFGLFSAAVIMLAVLSLSNKKYNVPIENVKALRLPNNAFTLFKALSDKHGVSLSRLVTYYMLENNFFPAKTVLPTVDELEQKYVLNLDKFQKKYNQQKIQVYVDLFKNIFDEIKVFPIPTGYDKEDTPSYIYGDSWGAKRDYKSDRIHMGTDIMDRENLRGRIPVISMTNGTIDTLGWNELGGYSVGILTESGNYYYYAHLDKYAAGLVQGSKISAGRLLGFMGDSGYGREGTKGKFVVHLHIGIKVNTKLSNKEFWINPYPFLRFYEAYKNAYVNEY